MGPIKKKRRLEKLKREKALEFLCVTFPKCFIPRDSEEPVKPLAIGTDKVVLEAVQDKLPEKITMFHIKGALHVYCHSLRYRKAISKAGTARINIAGEEVGKVTEEEVKVFFEARAKAMEAWLKEKTAKEKTSPKKAKKPAAKPKLKINKPKTKSVPKKEIKVIYRKRRRVLEKV